MLPICSLSNDECEKKFPKTYNIWQQNIVFHMAFHLQKDKVYTIIEI